jgi:hypothetical protein
MKAHKSIPELTLLENDANLVAVKVQDCIAKVWYDAENKREEIINKLSKVKETLEKLQLNVA